MTDPLLIIDKYYQKDSNLRYILLTHSEQVKNKALAIAQKHPELNIDTQFVAEAAMLHDIGIFMCDSPRIFCHGNHKYIEHGYLGSDLLRKEGLPKHALVCERHTGVGLTLETIIKGNLPLPHREMLPVTIEEQLICYADKFYSKSQLEEAHSLERIRTHLRHYGDSEVEKFNEWHQLFEG